MLVNAISTAAKTLESAPLTACLTKVKSDELLREACATEVKTAEELVNTFREEEAQKVGAGVGVRPLLCMSVRISLPARCETAKRRVDSRVVQCALH